MSSDGSTLLPPITKGGFSNDGSSVMAESQSAVPLAVTADGCSLALAHAGLTLLEFYEIKRIVEFLRQHSSRSCALQFPDDQLPDAVAVVEAVRTAWASSPVEKPCPSLYILGDTSYAPCCVDEVAAAHVDADSIVHFGPACFSASPSDAPLSTNVSSSSKRTPTLHVVGRIPLSPDARTSVVATLSERALPSKLFPSLAPDSTGAGKRVLVLYDQRLHTAIPALTVSLAAAGVSVIADASTRGAASAVSVDMSVSSTTSSHDMSVVFAALPGASAIPGPVTTAAGASSCDDPLSLCGFTWPPGPTDPDAEEPQSPHTRQSVWNLGFAPASWAVVVLVAPASAADSAAAAVEAAAARSGFGAPAALSDVRAEELAPRSRALLGHVLLNFPMHTIASVTLPSEPLSSAELRIESGSLAMSRVLGRRYLLIEKAKNAHIFGIVVCNLADGGAPAAIAVRRAQQVINDAGRKGYVLCVGRVNEPKLLNFPDIGAYVMVTCPLSVLLQSHGASGAGGFTDVVTPLELEFALSGTRSWTGEYSTDFRDVSPSRGRLGGGDGGDEDEEDADEPRYSPVDQRLHAPIRRRDASTAVEGAEAGGTTSWGLVEVGSSALTDAGFKPYKRTFIGLDPRADTTELGTTIRAGLHGTARGYATVGSGEKEGHAAQVSKGVE